MWCIPGNNNFGSEINCKKYSFREKKWSYGTTCSWCGISEVTMTTKRRLITDSFKVVKKARGSRREKRPTPPQPQKESPTELVRQKEHQELRQFDLDWRFGPCTGISRLQRWERANMHGLNPPEKIRDLLSQAHTDPEYHLSLWSEYPL